MINLDTLLQPSHYISRVNAKHYREIRITSTYCVSFVIIFKLRLRIIDSRL